MGRKKTTFQWERDSTEEEEPEVRASRGQAKREEQARKELIKRLLVLKSGERAGLPMSEELQEALDEFLNQRVKAVLAGESSKLDPIHYERDK